MGPKRFTDVELVGERVCLRPVGPNDASRAYELLQDDRVIESLIWDGLASVEESANGFRRRAEWSSYDEWCRPERENVALL